MAKRKSKTINYNRVLQVADYKPLGVETRKQWEVAMALRTLRDNGVTGPDAMILGVGAALERTIFELANGDDARFVVATDLYLDMGAWSGWASEEFLRTPGKFIPDGVRCDPHRIIPRHADMRSLPFPDDMFDGVFSSGSIEHVGKAGTPDWDAIETAMREIVRVVKPGGVISLSTEWKISGDGWGWDHVRLFDETLLRKHLIDASGCELIDDPVLDFDGDPEHLLPLANVVYHGASQVGYGLLTDHGFVFTSIHLALRKPE